MASCPVTYICSLRIYIFLYMFKQVADISVLASWYAAHDNYGNPVVVIIEDLERCCGTVLSDFILMLRCVCPIQ